MNTRKIAINTSYGGFGLTDAAIEMYLIKKNVPFKIESRRFLLSKRRNTYFVDNQYFSTHTIQRDDPALIETLEQLGEEAADTYCTFKIIEIPADVQWHIQEYDGREWIAENHRTWE